MNKFLFFTSCCIMLSLNVQAQTVDFAGVFQSTYNGSSSNYNFTLNTLEVTNLNQGCNEGIHLEFNKDVNHILREIDEISLELSNLDLNNDTQELNADFYHKCLMEQQQSLFGLSFKLKRENSTEYSFKEENLSPNSSTLFEGLNNYNLDDIFDYDIFPNNNQSKPKFKFKAKGNFPGRSEAWFMFSVPFTSFNIDIPDGNGNLVTYTNIDSLQIVYDFPCTPDIISCDITSCNVSSFDIINGYVSYKIPNTLCYLEGQVCSDISCGLFGGKCNNDCDCLDVADVPTLSQWSLIILALLLMIISVIGIKNKSNEIQLNYSKSS